MSSARAEHFSGPGAGETRARPLRLLIADNFPDIADGLARLISIASPFPVEASVAYDGAMALAQAVWDPPDVAILDIRLPSLDGFEAALAIRKCLGTRAPLLVALTSDPGHWSEPTMDRAFDHFLVKPADVDQLIGLVASAAGPESAAARAATPQVCAAPTRLRAGGARR